MKKFYFGLLMMAALLVSQTIGATGFSASTDDDNTYWYFLKFTQGELVVSSNGEGQVCRSATPRTRKSQLWKLVGTDANGYRITNQLGLSLTYTGTAEGDSIKAVANPTANYLFAITQSGSNYLITPKSNTGQGLNCWGGMNAGNAIRLYRSTDRNAPMNLVADSVYAASAQLPIIPYPAKLTRGTGTLALSALTGYQNNVAGNDSVAGLLTTFAADLQTAAGISLKQATSGKLLTFTLDNTLGREAYKLDIADGGITVTASSYAGFLYALTTIRQLLPREIFTGQSNTGAEWSLPIVSIEDEPDMPVRGFMLDVARHFFTLDEVKKIIDAASVYKLNRFHWHLTDDQGWRIQIPEYPKLTEVGAIRKGSVTLNAVGNLNFNDDTEYGRGCYYTLEQLKDVVNYAKARNVEILPEVDLPGHMVAAIASYPWLSCDSTQAYNDSYKPLGTPKEVRIATGVSRDVLDVSKDTVISFLKTVLGHVADVFPYPYIHIGGDECPTDAWEATQSVKDWMATKGFSSAHDIQPWLVEELGSWLRDEKGKGVTVWNELVVKGYWKNEYSVKPVVFSYSNNTQNNDNRNVVKQVTEKGFRTIATTTTPMYFDLLQASASEMEEDAPYCGGYGDGWVNTVQMVYNYNPKATAEDSAHLVIGTQGTLWTESCTSGDEAEYEFFPRLLAVSEVGWLPYSKKNYTDFYARLQDHESLLKAKKLHYAPYAFDAPELSAAETALQEADTLLSQSRPGLVGYPSQEAFNALSTATEALRAAQSDAALLSALQTAVATYKAAAVKMPEAGKIYEIISASTQYKRRYNGSSLYAKGTNLNIHYTPQTEPEEVYAFTPAPNGGFYIKNLSTGKNIVLGAANSNATLSATDSTAIIIRPALKASQKYTYVPGVVNLRGANGVLYAQPSGVTIVGTDSTLCWPASWRIREITDYTAQLQGLVNKATRIIEEAKPGETGQPTQEAIDYLKNSVLAPATAAVSQGNVSQQTYDEYVELYKAYTEMPITSALSGLSEDYYYLIRNGYHTGKYAIGNSSNQVIPADAGSTDYYKWQIKKNADGTVSLINKGTGTAAYVGSDNSDQRVLLGNNYNWILEEITTDLGGTGLSIQSGEHTYGWYTNPSAWQYILLKGYNWGASIWTFERTTEAIDDLTAINTATIPSSADGYSTITDVPAAIYDLQGRRITQPARGIYIQGGKKYMK